ncbi:MAG TPA: SCO family protein [Polyangiaceae bacterium]|nr:SCO family protein [Polyangiaceae bacterium]
MSRGLRVAVALGAALSLTSVLVATGGDAFDRVARTLHPAAPLPVLGRVPAFRLVDQRGEPYSDQAMRGRVSVVDFIFTRCTSSCPRLTARMADLQARLRRQADVRFVSFSVDPENDTPAVLAAYASRAGADPARWTFVTGPLDDVEAAAVLGFKVSAAKIAKGADDYDVVHGDWFVLVDRAGQLRGYYPTDDPRDLDAVVDAAKRLEAEDAR